MSLQSIKMTYIQKAILSVTQLIKLKLHIEKYHTAEFYYVQQYDSLSMKLKSYEILMCYIGPIFGKKYTR